MSSKSSISPQSDRKLLIFASLAGAMSLAAAYSSPMWLPLSASGGEPVSPALQHPFATAWAAMLMTMPAFCAFWFRQDSKAAMNRWLSFWSVGFAVFLVHFVQATFIFFDNDWSKILNSELVTLPRLDTFVTLWWAVDVALAWSGIAEGRAIRIQRMALHLILLSLFLLGSLKEGSYTASFVAGALLGIPVLIAIYLRWSRSRWDRLKVVPP